MEDRFVTDGFLRENKECVFVFGDNTLRKGKGGAAKLRDHQNSYGFITKIYPDNRDNSFYRPNCYEEVFKSEIERLKIEATSNPDNIYMVSQLGAGLANRYKIWDKIIKPRIKIELKGFKNIEFLW